MNCIKCGQQLSETARFCPLCGTPVVGGRSRAEIRRRLIIGGGVAVLLVVASAVLFFKRPQPSVVPVVAPQAQPPGGDSPKIAPAQITPAQIAGFDWSGLSPEQLQSARTALDEAIAKEEQGRAVHR